MRTKWRIVRRDHHDQTVEYVVQRTHWLFRWMYADLWESHWYPHIVDSFSSLEGARLAMELHSGSKTFSVDTPVDEEEA